MRYVKLVIINALVLLSVGCASNSEKTYFDKNTNINTVNYKTFSWLTKEKIMGSTFDTNPVMIARVSKSIEQAFITKGYNLVDDAEKSDFTISYTIGSRVKTNIHTYPASYNNTLGWRRGYYDLSSSGTETNIRQYTEGKLAIDVYDVKTQQPVWHGWATKRITSKQNEAPLKVINGIVTSVVDTF